MSIHPTAIVDTGAELGRNVSVGPHSIIGPDVVIGDDCWIGPQVVINGPTRIGTGNRIYQFASIGEAPQDLKYAGEPTQLEIGDRNTIRECATINRGTVNGGGITRVGDDNLLMAYIHIAHDCTVGNGTVFSNNASLAGHVDIGNQVILSGFTLVHQFCSVGDHAFTGMGSAIS
ncbi:MAG: acyl-ACP--UDP-N-acetylglucosamine O-acyltransferase, partial [Candidatus Thiodiazotropha endolucinida]